MVASVPSNHVYVRHIAAEHDDGVVRLPDPDPDAPARSAQERWWPPVMLSPEWIGEHDFDVFHVQFGFDAWAPEDLAAVVSAHPRPHFKRDILRAFTDGMKDRPDTTFGTMNDDVLAHFVPGFVREDFVEVSNRSAWPD